MKIKDLPQPIKELALKRQVEYKNQADDKDTIPNAFKWSKTFEKHDFWKEINNGNFQPFYDLYPQNVDTSNENVDTCRDKHVQSVIEKFKQRSELGYLKYGTTLERQDLSISQWIKEAQQEAMDFCLYLEKIHDELAKNQ